MSDAAEQLSNNDTGTVEQLAYTLTLVALNGPMGVVPDALIVP